jgi:hypothetical protein
LYPGISFFSQKFIFPPRTHDSVPAGTEVFPILLTLALKNRFNNGQQ